MTLIREARREDCQSILDLIRELATYEREPDAVVNTVEALEEHLFGPQPAVFCHVAEHGGRVIGLALWFLTYSTWEGRHGIHLDDLYISPEHRGKGTGFALLKTLAEICVERGYRRLEWTVLDWNAPAIAFYESIGSHSMDGWSTRRLDGDALRRLGAPEGAELG